jgi:protein-tyrosine phosphatase
MEYEEINITKIKDGLFLGDEATSNNLDIIIKFKITRMINTAGNDLINAWESIGIKYLTIKWSESSSQNLFDAKDEIANKIVKIIDDADKLGEGILIHSVRGRNRACIVVIIYLMKK